MKCNIQAEDAVVVVVEDLAVVADAADLHEEVAAGVEHRGEAVEEADEVHRVVVVVGVEEEEEGGGE